MSRGNWKDNVLLQLKEKNEKFRADGLLDTFNYLDNQIKGLQDRNELLKTNSETNKLDKTLNLNKKLQKTLDEQNRLVKEKEMVNNELIVAYGKAKKEKESTKEEYKKLEKKYTQLQEEMALSKKIMESINDHILELQFENNMLLSQKKP